MKLKLCNWAAIVVFTALPIFTHAQDVSDATVVDAQKPSIALFGEKVVQLTVGDNYADAGAFAVDQIDGIITDLIVVSGEDFDTDAPGTFIISYDVTDAAGNEADTMERIVTVNPVVAPDPVDPAELECDDAPPYGNNKGWDGLGNCHVNGDPWVVGISDQPGYEPGDTAIEQQEIIDEKVIIQEEEIADETEVEEMVEVEDVIESADETGENEVVQEVVGTDEVIVNEQSEADTINPTESSITTVNGDYTFVTTMPRTIEQGEISTIEIEVTNNSGPEEFVLYTFLSKLPVGAAQDDEGSFITDRFFEGQALSIGETKIYSFSWLNDEAAGDYKFFGEIKSADWSETLQKSQIAQVEVNGTDQQSVGQTLHRFYSAQYKGHFYTISEKEKQHIIENDPNWNYEGIGNKTVNQEVLSSSDVQKLGITPVYRFWNDTYKHHFYTISESEKQATIENPEWAYEDVAYYTYATRQMDTTEVYRFYSPVYKGHFYTISSDERDALMTNDENWVYEGIAWYAQR